MKKVAFLIILCWITGQTSFSQRWKLKRYEAIVGIGALNLFTDLGVSNAESLLGFRIDFTRPDIYVAARYKFSQDFSGKIGLAYGYGHSHDISNERIEGTEGFRSNTHIIEPCITAEYYIKKEERRYRSAAIYNRRGMLNNYSTWGIYFYGGLGGLYYDAVYDFTPRPGDKTKENGFTLIIPAGIGLKYIYSDKIVFGYELGPRYVFSDYLDGFKPPSSRSNDVYWLTTITLAYKIKTSRRNLPLFLDRRLRRASR
ncbi:MAG: hypothetical protein JW723_09085 [Bacteroidales bacterium]|nr:hypothetical protein [Bacteroidales bacterium]